MGTFDPIAFAEAIKTNPEWFVSTEFDDLEPDRRVSHPPHLAPLVM